jgi:hypothetical protein
MPDLFKEIIPSILERKNVVLNTPEDDKSYVPFVVNKAISFHMDCGLLANEMNLLPHLDKRLQYHFLLHTVRSWKRPFRKWMKLEKTEDVEVIKEHYKVSDSKAKEYLAILSEDQLNDIRTRMNKSGLKNSYGKQQNSRGRPDS